MSGPALAQAPPPELWTLSLDTSSRWDNNVNLASDGDAGITSRYGLGISYIRNTPLTQLSANGSGSATHYIAQAGGDRFWYSGTLRWSRSLSPRTRFSISDSINSSFTQTAPLLADNGLVFPYTQTLTNELELGLDHGLSERHALALSARHDHVVFRESELLGGDQANLDASYRLRFGPRTLGGLTYSFRLLDLDTLVLMTHSVYLNWSRQLGQYTDLSLAAGGTASPAREGQPALFSPVGSVSLGHQTERNRFSLSFHRRVDQAFGFGRQRVGDVVNLSWSREIGRIWNIRLNGGYGRSRDPSDVDFGYESQYLAGGFGVRPTRNFGIGADGRAVRRSLSDGRADTSLGAGISMSYSWEWR